MRVYAISPSGKDEAGKEAMTVSVLIFAQTGKSKLIKLNANKDKLLLS